MSTRTIPLPLEPPRALSRRRQLLALIPGTALLFAVGLAGKGMESLGHSLRARHIPFPQVEYVLWAILLGLAIGNVIRLPAIFRPGLATYELWLKLGIVLVGAKFLLGDLLHLGGLSLILVAIELTLSLSVMTLLGRVFKLRPKLTSLLAIGSSICGVTAIMAAQGAIDPEEQDTSTAIAAILTLGAIALFAFPAIGHALHMGQQSYGLWTGLAVDNTAEATVTGALYGDLAGRIAILAKTARSSFIGFVVLGYAVYWASRGQAQHVEHKALFLWQKFPKFILGFVAISVLATIGFFSASQLTSLGNLSKWAFLPAFAGVGLRTQLRDLIHQGWRPILVGVLGEIFLAALTLAMVFLATHGATR
ncbi:MAG TPA: putative sulfate exporter family transporter [Candidatus Aquilonibacter sp.]|nr:putative sulfate exporter family transporter [Candidatus Aquilonibacter sp.]